jgi:glycolate oxidase FAD binding subunit
VIAANVSGPRRRAYGTARDLVIGMKFAMLDGRIAQSGGMVVKNVAGLDMGKLMIGSFGTLAAMVSVNFKLTPQPEQTRTFLFEHPTASAAAAQASALIAGQLQPCAIDIWKKSDGRGTFAIQAAGSSRVIARYEREFAGSQALAEEAERGYWAEVRALAFTRVVVVRVSCQLTQVGSVLAGLPGEALARAGNGVVYGFFADWQGAAEWCKKSKWTAIVESAQADCPAEVRWPQPGTDFGVMEKVKDLFDPKRLLNRGRLYGRI